MIKLNIIGQFFGSSGYANHLRQLSNALNKYCDVKVTTQVFPGWELQVNDEELKMINKPDDKERVNLIVDLPFNWGQYLFKEKNICFLVWEGNKIPLSFVDYLKDERINQIWVPSTHTYDAVKNTIDNSLEWQTIKNKIKIVPHGVNSKVFFPTEKPKDVFRFLANKGFKDPEDRGGMQYLIKAYTEEFSGSDNVELVLKINPSYGVFDFIKSGLITPKPNLPRLMVNTDNLAFNELVKMYNSAHVFVAPTRADAFNLPCLEAMSCGLPVLTTNYGGQIDFVNDSNGWLIDYELTEVKHELFYEGISWATPKLDHLKKLMRKIYEDKQLTEKVENSLKTANEWRWDNSAQKAVNCLKEL